MKLKKNHNENSVFIIILLLVLLATFISSNSSCLFNNPFEKEELLVNPVKLCTSNDNIVYISDSSNEILIADKQNRLLNKIESDGGEMYFDYADEIAIGTNGEIYIQDNILAENGVDILNERILKFNSSGKREKILYETNASGKNMESIVIDSFKMIDGNIYFSEISQKGVKVLCLKGEEAIEIGFAEYEDKNNMISDSSFDLKKNEIAFALKNGDVFIYKNEKLECLYSAREHDNEDYFSIISELAYGNGGLYLCDIGQRKVIRMNTETLKFNTIISENEFSLIDSDKFSDAPIFSGLDVSNNTVSVLTTEYTYDENKEPFYLYGMAAVSEEGEELFYYDRISISPQRIMFVASVNIVAILILIISIYSVFKIVVLIKNSNFEESSKLQIIMIVTALAVTIGISYIIFESYNSRIVNESASNLCNIAYLIGEKINFDDLENINSPDSVFGKSYKNIDKAINEILQSNINKKNNLYCVIYKVKNNVMCEAYRDDFQHCLMYPMTGGFSGSGEEELAANNEYSISYEFALSEGIYMYALVPLYDETGKNIAFIETGMDYSAFTGENNRLYTKVLMLAVMAVIIFMLLLSEVLYSVEAVKAERISKKKKIITSPEVIRPIAFLFFGIANISTAFLPIYGMNLCEENSFISPELAAAFPLSAEMILAALSAFICGFIIKKTGIKAICVTGGVFYILGNIFSAFAPNIIVLIFANSLCGIGSGCLSLALNTWAAGFNEEENRNKGFIHINAAYLSGLNCGTVIGSLIWENFGINAAYFTGAAAALALIVICFIMISKTEEISDEENEETDRSIKEIISPNIIKYFICINIPYLICAAFLGYFFPIEAEEAELSATHISMAFLLSGMISIYTGSSLAEIISEKLGIKKAMILASFIYALALIYLSVNPSITSCYIVVALFAVADSFGLSAQAVYFSSLPEVEKVGQSKALGLNNTIESITTACGSLVFGAVLTLGTQKGILIIAAVFSVMLGLFMLFGKNRIRKEI